MNKTLRLLFIGVAAICFSNSKAQNFVADSSFEHNSAVPVLLSSIGMNTSWSAPTGGTTDLFCECGKKLKEKSEAQVPANPFGTQKANSGKCYAGFYLFSHGDYREYLITQLMQPLTAGVKYDLTFYISLADYSRAAIYRMGVAFLRGAATQTSNTVLKNINPVNVPLKNQVGTDTIEWHKMYMEYKAKGGEQFLLIGSFDIYDFDETDVKPPKGNRTKINQNTARDAYYYIDDVSLRKQPPVYTAYFDTIVKPKIDTLKPTLVTYPTIDTSGNSLALETALKKSLVLKNVLFETGKAVLLPQSYPELDMLANYLIDNKTYKIEISGHTDNVGNETTNAKLSELRAKAVSDYLITKSVDPGRITHKGYGSTMPIVPNDSEEGRKQNRRVEFKFLK